MKVVFIEKSLPTEDGDGVKISRISDFMGGSLDPFLMIDELRSSNVSDYIGGFPPHPHRGLETFTYMVNGAFEHKDQMGNKKLISKGHVQWMSTGYGVIHSEMPKADDLGMHGFQIWVNMPAKDKLRPARYMDSVIPGLPVIDSASGVSLKALAGSWSLDGKSITSPLSELSSGASIADLFIPEGGSVTLDRSQHDQAFLYIYSGETPEATEGHLIKVDPLFPISVYAKSDVRVLVFSGIMIRERVAHLGPFVMNTEAELRQAVDDYQRGKFGNIAL